MVGREHLYRNPRLTRGLSGLEHMTGDRVVLRTNPAGGTSLQNFGNFVHSHFCQCLSEKTLKAVGPFYLVSMPGEVKDPTQRVNM